ncbi:MAG: DUF2283 domain-containing protein [Dehalococcoidales bacterium]|nr:DUF2283 domain-containing protein [Dehalococcoidales bacterium]
MLQKIMNSILLPLPITDEDYRFMKISYDKKADAIYISLNDKPYAYGKDLDEERRIDFDSDDNPIGIELLCVSAGVNTDDLPKKTEVERILTSKGIKVLV